MWDQTTYTFQTTLILSLAIWGVGALAWIVFTIWPSLALIPYGWFLKPFLRWLEAFDGFLKRNWWLPSAILAVALLRVFVARTGKHPEFGRVTLGQHLATWVAHDLGHIAQTSRVMAKQYRDAVGPWRAYLPVLSRTSAIARDKARCCPGRSSRERDRSPRRGRRTTTAAARPPTSRNVIWPTPVGGTYRHPE